MYVSTRLNRKDAKKFRQIARELGISDYKLLTSLVELLLQNPKKVIPQLKPILSASKEQQHPHSKSSTLYQKAPKSSAHSPTDC